MKDSIDTALSGFTDSELTMIAIFGIPGMARTFTEPMVGGSVKKPVYRPSSTPMVLKVIKERRKESDEKSDYPPLTKSADSQA